MIRRMFLLVVWPLMALVVGVVSVSAFEAHVVNVTARVSNALSVAATAGTSIGTQAAPADPLTWKKLSFEVALSASFTAQTRVSTVSYIVCGEPKPNTHPGTTNLPLAPYIYLWMGGSAFVEIDPPVANTGPFYWIGPTTNITLPPNPPFATCPQGATSTLNRFNDLTDTVYLWYEVPVFNGYYNTADDGTDKPRNDLADCGTRTDGQPCVILPIPPASTGGTLLGMDLKFQVTAIN